ncbi:unnamed protein product, partial [Prorocentrum cordatum]
AAGAQPAYAAPAQPAAVAAAQPGAASAGVPCADEADPSAGWVGDWAYDESSYTVGVGAGGRYLFEEVIDARGGVRHSGVLSLRGGWLEGDLVNQDGRVVGSIRLRREEGRRALISQVRPLDGQWEKETVARPAGDRQAPDLSQLQESMTPVLVLVVSVGAGAFYLWSTVSWRFVVRPMLCDAGLEECVVQAEGAWRDLQRWRRGGA